MKDHLAVLNQVLQFLLNARQAEQLVQEGLTLLAEVTGWAGVFLLIPDVDAESVRIASSAGPFSSSLDVSRLTLDHRIIAEVLRTKTTSCTADPDAATLGCLAMDGAAGALMIPLKRGERVYMVLYIVDDKPGICDDDSRTLAEALGGAFSLALQNARLYETLQHEVNERQLVEDRFWTATHKTQTLYLVSRSLMSSYHLDDMLRMALDNITTALRAERTLLLRCDSGDVHQVRSFWEGGRAESTSQPLYDDLLLHIAGGVVRDGLPVALSKTAVQNRLVSKESPNPDILVGSVAVAPLFLHDQTCGVLMAVNRPDQRDFTQHDVDLLMATSAQIVGAMRSAELFQEIVEERERLRAIVHSSRDGVILLGLDFRILVLNRPAARLLGMPGEAETWEDRVAWDAIRSFRKYSPQAVRAVMEEIRRVRSGDNQPREGEVKIGVRMVHWLSLPVRGPVHVLGRLVVLRDVTEARLADQFREDLMHTMVHDLRNPLTGIYAALSLFARGTGDLLSPGQRQILDIAYASAQRMLKLVNAILDIGRLESGQMPLTPTVFRLSDIVDELIEIERPIIEQSGLQFINTITTDIPLVRADRGLIERVLENLVGNALKFTPSGGQVQIVTGIEPDIPGKLCVSVVDTGPGIPPNIRRDLFTKFVTGEHEARGSGLGLAFCRMVLEAHGERIWISKTSEKGTIFTFTLPLASSFGA